MASLARGASVTNQRTATIGTITGWSRRVSDQDDITSVALLWAIHAVLVLLFFTSFIVTPSTVFPFIVGKAVWSRSLIEIIAGLYILLAIRSPEYRPRRSWLILLFGFQLGSVLIAGIFGSSFNLSFWSSYERMGGILDLAHWLTLASILVIVVRGLHQWKTLVAIYLGVSWAAAVVAIGESFEHRIFDWVLVGNSGGRIAGPAGNPSFLSGQMMVNGMLALALFVDALRSWVDGREPGKMALAVFFGVTAITSLWLLSETGTRGSLAGLVAGVATAAGLFTLYTNRRRIRYTLVIIGAVVPIAVVLLFIGRDTSFVQNLASKNQTVDRVLSSSLNEAGLSQRTIGLRIAGEAFMARPLTGWGGENFEVPYQRYQRPGEVPPSTWILDRAHNKPLNLLATTGIIGFTAFIAVWGWFGVLSWRRVREDPVNRLFHAIVAGTVVALFIHNLFLFDTAVTFLLFALLVAWASLGESNSEGVSDNAPVPVRSRGAAQGWIQLAAPILVAVVVTASVYGVNWRIFRAAQLIGEPEPTVGQIVENLNHFSPLATFGRERLLNVMSDRWWTLDPVDRIELIEELEDQAEVALAAEGDNMELHFAVARFYRAASMDLPELIERARFHTDRGVQLGPNTSSAERARSEQLAAEAALSTAS